MAYEQMMAASFVGAQYIPVFLVIFLIRQFKLVSLVIWGYNHCELISSTLESITIRFFIAYMRRCCFFGS